MESNSQNNNTSIYIITALSLLVFLAYSPLLSADFVNYDDPFYVTANSHVKGGLSVDSIRWAFSTLYFYNWHPLTWLSHMLDVQLFGLNPMGHHLTSMLLHIGNTLLLFILLKRTTGSVWKSACVAALFALHPLHVQPVAWISDRKDLLSTLFGLMAMLSYVAYARKLRVGAYFLFLLLFAVGLMAKPMLVTLPFLLLLLDFWPMGRLRSGTAVDENGSFRTVPLMRLLLEKLPPAAMSIASIIITWVAQGKGGGIHSESSLAVNAGTAVVSYFSYALKMLWPGNLSAYYPYNPAAVQPWQVGLALAVIGAFSVLAIVAARRFPYCTVGWFWYIGAFVPVIGFIRIGEQAMADRYTYVPLIGLFILIVWGVADLTDRLRFPDAAVVAAATMLITACTLLAFLQARTWHDSGTLFSHALEVTENNWIAHKNLAAALAKQGDFGGALLHATESLRIRPEPQEYVSQGWLYLQLGMYDKAVEACRNSLAMMPVNDKAHFIMGLSFVSLKDFRSAQAEYEALRDGNSPYAAQLLDKMNGIGMR